MTSASTTSASRAPMTRGQRLMMALATLLAVVAALGQFAAIGAAADTGPAGGGAVVQNYPTEDVDWRQSLTTNPCSPRLQPPMDNLPVVRWANSSNEFHTATDLSGWDISGQISLMMRNVTGGLSMVFGNGLFGFTTQIVDGATRFCPLNEFGAQMDNVAGTVGKAIISSPLLLVAGIVLVIAFFMSKMRGDGAHTVASMLKKALALAVLVIVTIGASASTSPSPGVYNPGTMSPGWLMLNVDRVTSALSSTLVSAFPTSVIDTDITGHDGDDLSCVHYTRAMNNQYEAQMKRADGGSGMGPSMVSKLWETSGMRAWKETQFGTNTYSDLVYCRMLEANSHKSSWVAAGGPGSDGPSMQNFQNAAFVLAGNTRSHMPATPRPLFKAADGGKYNAAAMIVFAACKLNDNGNIAQLSDWTIRSEQLLPPKSRDKRDDGVERCHRLFNATELDKKDFEFFQWDGKKDQIVENVSDPQALDFLLSLHAHAGQSNVMSLGMFFIGAIAVLVIIGGMGAGLFLAKMATVLLGVGLLLLLLWSLFGRGGDKRVMDFAKQYIGMSFFVFAFGLLLGIVALVASLVADLSRTMFPTGGVGAVAIVALSPVIAAVLVKMLFKKVGLPNPLSISGGLAFANAARSMSPDSLGSGGGGGAASALERGERRVGARAKRLGGAAAKGLLPAGLRPRSGNTAEAAISGSVAGLMAGGATNAVSGLVRKRDREKFNAMTKDVDVDDRPVPAAGAAEVPAGAVPGPVNQVGDPDGVVPKRGIPAVEAPEGDAAAPPRPFETEEQRWERVRLENEHAAAAKKAKDARAALDLEQAKRDLEEAEAAVRETGAFGKVTAAAGKVLPVAQKAVIGTALTASALALPGGVFAVGAFGAWKGAKGAQALHGRWKNRDAVKAQRELSKAEDAAEQVERQQRVHDARLQLEAQKKLLEANSGDSGPAGVVAAGAGATGAGVAGAAGAGVAGGGRRNTTFEALDPATAAAAERKLSDQESAELQRRAARPRVSAPADAKTGAGVSTSSGADAAAAADPAREGGAGSDADARSGTDQTDGNGRQVLEETKRAAAALKGAFEGAPSLRRTKGDGSGVEKPKPKEARRADEGGQV